MLSRLFLVEKYQLTVTCVIVASDSVWQRQFGGDPAVIGRTLSVNQRQCTIIGILPKTFQFPRGAELWVPQNR